MPTVPRFDLLPHHRARTIDRAARVLVAFSLALTAMAYAGCSGDPDGNPGEHERLVIEPETLQGRPGMSVVVSVQHVEPGRDPVAIAPSELEWETSDETVATVEDGLITAVAEGTATITGKWQGLQATVTVEVLEELATITVTPWELLLTHVGATGSLSPVAQDPDGVVVEDDPSRFTYESSDETVATVSASGLVTAQALGEAFVHVRLGEAETSVWIRVERATVAIGFAENPVHLDYVGHRVELQPVALDAENEEIEALTGLTWESSDEDVATVDGFGRVTGWNDGTALITGRYGELSGEVEVIVRQKAAKLQVSHESLELTAVGDTVLLSASAVDAAEVGIPLSASDFTWTSDDPTVATVDGEGLVTAVSRGSTVVHVQRDEVGVDVPVTVVQVPADVELTPPSLQFDWLGQTTTVAALVRDVTGDPIPTTPDALQWISTDTAVATVDGEGVVTAVGAGTTSIRATFEGVHGTASVTVKQVPTWFEMSPEDAILEVGQTLTPTFQARDAGGSAIALTGADLSWISSDESVVTVSNAGVLTAVGAGSAHVEATSGTLTRVIEILVPDGPEWWITFDWVDEAPLVDADWSSVFVSGEYALLVGTRAAVWIDESRDGSGFVDAALERLPGSFAALDSWVSSNRALVLEANALHAIGTNDDDWSVDHASATPLRALDVAGDTAMVVGDDGLVLVRTDTGWEPMDSTVEVDLVGIDVVSANAAWAVTATGDVLFYDGDLWSVWASPLLTPVGIREGADGVVYVAGTSSSGAPVVYWLDGDGYWKQSLPFPTAAQVSSFDVTTGGRVFLTTVEGEVIEWSDGAWSTGFRARYPLSRVRADESGRAVAVGAGGTVLVFDGERWTTASGNRGSLNAAFAPSRDVLFAVGDAGTFLTRDDAGRWRDVASSVEANLLSVWAVDGADAWAVGENGTVARFDGETLSALESPTTETLRVVWGTSPDDVWIGGDFGTLFRWDGSSWTRVNPVESRRYLAATGAAGEVRFAGTGGLVVDAAGAAIPSDLIGATFTSLASFQTGEFFALSSEGHLLSFDGDTLRTQQSITYAVDGKLWGRSATDLFVLTHYADSTTGLLRWDGDGFTEVMAPGDAPRFDAHYTSLWGMGSRLVVVGDGGRVLVGSR